MGLQISGISLCPMRLKTSSKLEEILFPDRISDYGLSLIIYFPQVLLNGLSPQSFIC